MKRVEVAPGIRTITKRMFRRHRQLETISIPSSVKIIEDFAFEGCINLRKVGTTEGLSKIGNSAFEGCELLESIDIPSTVRVIGEKAFADCSIMTRVNMLEGLQKIGVGAFQHCKALGFVGIPSSVTHIGTVKFMIPPFETADGFEQEPLVWKSTHIDHSGTISHNISIRNKRCVAISSIPC